MSRKIPASVSTNDYANSRFCICTVNSGYANDRIMRYTTVEERCISRLCEYLLRQTLAVMPLQNLPVNKRLKIFFRIHLIAKSLSMCTKSVCPTNIGLLEELTLFFLYILVANTAC